MYHWGLLSSHPLSHPTHRIIKRELRQLGTGSGGKHSAHCSLTRSLTLAQRYNRRHRRHRCYHHHQHNRHFFRLCDIHHTLCKKSLFYTQMWLMSVW